MVKVSICMAAYNPPASLFRRQIESIRAQTFTSWTCIITVDADDRDVIRHVVGKDRRFKIIRNRKRLGFYRNFEKALSLAPPADFIALADQDDEWNPDKLETLLCAFNENTQLVYSDCRVVSDNGDIISPTFWHTRRNNFTNFACLIIANSVTGAACMFRSSLLSQILPFPGEIEGTYHDNWIAVIAAANGDIGYIERPLYDYIQHGGNVIGDDYAHNYPGIYVYGREVLKNFRSRRAIINAFKETSRQGVEHYAQVRKVALLSRTALDRSNCRNMKKRRILSRLARYDQGLASPIFERVRAALDRRPSLNFEGLLLHAAVSKRIHQTGFINLPPRGESPPLKAPPVTTLDPWQMPQHLFLQHPLD